MHVGQRIFYHATSHRLVSFYAAMTHMVPNQRCMVPQRSELTYMRSVFLSMLTVIVPPKSSRRLDVLLHAEHKNTKGSKYANEICT